ncbi:hypothetical protein A2U01_0078340, partial [Trifolium medium]|nr:hypothetical protein [Trifolium medium]
AKVVMTQSEEDGK